MEDLYRRPEIQVDAFYGCYLWKGPVDRNGYGYITLPGEGGRWGVKAWAHRYFFEQERGPVPEKKSLDHMCRRLLCVRAWHMEAVTARENTLRRTWRHRSKRTHCPEGHMLYYFGRRTPEAGIVCLKCAPL